MRAPALALILALGLSPARGGEASWPDLSSPARATGGGERDAAVVVGIENYFKVPGVPGAGSNAKEWYEYLTRTRGVPPQNVKLLIDEDAAKEEILDAASVAAGRVGRGGNLWFVFVGHGAPSADGKDGLLVGVDAQQTAESLQARSVRRGELLKVLGKSEAAAIPVLIDACFSGRAEDGSSLAPGLQPLVAVTSPRSLDSRVVVLTAARGDQFAGALPGENRPAFSYLALGALRGWAASGRRGALTAGDLWRYASDALAATLRGRRQDPDIIGNRNAVVGVSAGETGPNLAELAESTAGGGGAPRRPPAEAFRTSPVRRNPGRAPAGLIRWVKIPGGRFMMGSGMDPGSVNAKPVHRVTVAPFEMAKTLVTNRQYRACMAAGACTPPHISDGRCLISVGRSQVRGILPATFLGDDQPVVCVEWTQARDFSAWAGGRLPSEAEWEYAARGGGKDRIFPWGDEDGSCARAALYGCASATVPVCSKPAGTTAQGLCDMAGEATEWMQDRYHDSYAGAPSDGSAWEAGGVARVFRGGSWANEAEIARSGRRGGNSEWYAGDNAGFRPAR